MIKTGCLFFALLTLSFGTWSEGLSCPEGSGAFFSADNGKQSVVLCLKDLVSGIYVSSGQLTARVLAKDEKQPLELSMPELFGIRYGEAVGPKSETMVFESVRGRLALKVEAKFLDVSQLTDSDIKLCDLKANMELSIGEWVWQKDFCAISKEIDAIKHGNSQLMAGKLIVEPLSQAMAKTTWTPRLVDSPVDYISPKMQANEGVTSPL